MNLERVCVYGTLRKGNHNHILLSESRFLGNFITPPIYRMYNMGCPFITHVENGTPITTEVYEVNQETSWYLDSLEGFPRFYNREQINTPYGKAWIYFIDDYMTPEIEKCWIESGDWDDR